VLYNRKTCREMKVVNGKHGTNDSPVVKGDEKLAVILGGIG